MFDFAKIRTALGVPQGEDILKFIDRQPPDVAQDLHTQLVAMEEEVARQTQTAPGCPELLALLRSRGMQLGILTRNTRENALISLDMMGVRHHFDDLHILGRHGWRGSSKCCLPSLTPHPTPQTLFQN